MQSKGAQLESDNTVALLLEAVHLAVELAEQRAAMEAEHLAILDAKDNEIVALKALCTGPSHEQAELKAAVQATADDDEVLIPGQGPVLIEASTLAMFEQLAEQRAKAELAEQQGKWAAIEADHVLALKAKDDEICQLKRLEGAAAVSGVSEQCRDSAVETSIAENEKLKARDANYHTEVERLNAEVTQLKARCKAYAEEKPTIEDELSLSKEEPQAAPTETHGDIVNIRWKSTFEQQRTTEMERELGELKVELEGNKLKLGELNTGLNNKERQIDDLKAMMGEKEYQIVELREALMDMGFWPENEDSNVADELSRWMAAHKAAVANMNSPSAQALHKSPQYSARCKLGWFSPPGNRIHSYSPLSAHMNELGMPLAPHRRSASASPALSQLEEHVALETFELQ